MCRLLGIVSSETTEFRIVLRESVRSLAALSREHRDGWGLAIYSAERGSWQLDKGIACASEDEKFHRLAVGSRGQQLIAHIRQRTVGLTSIENTHPFQNGRWMFAHNGTIKDVAWLADQVSSARRAEIRGQTDSELFFAYLLTRLDDAGLTADAPTAKADDVIRRAAAEACARPGFGAINFLLGDGETLYAHRFGRTLFILERGPGDAVRSVRSSRDGTMVETPWSQRRCAIVIASEQTTDEPWQAITDGLLLRIDRSPLPRWRLLAVAA